MTKRYFAAEVYIALLQTSWGRGFEDSRIQGVKGSSVGDLAFSRISNFNIM